MNISTLEDQPSGACRRLGCPVVVGEAPCLLGQPLIDCEYFDPDPDSPVPTVAETAVLADSDAETSSVALMGVTDRPLPAQEPAGRDYQNDTEGPGMPSMEEALVAAASGLTDPLDGAPERDLLEPDVSDSHEHNESDVIDSSATRPRRRVRKPEGPKNTVSFDDGPAMPIRSGLALTVSEARDVMASEPAKLVVFAGPPDAGKTTLLAAMYETLLTQRIGSWSFAGSRTLLAFAMRSYWASTASGAVTPITPRTRYDLSRPWLHLRLAHQTRPSAICSLLLADISGEYFSTVGGGGDLNDAAGLVARADHVVHVLDAGLFESRAERLRALAATESLIRRLVSAPHVSKKARHTVVMTKADICPGDFRTKALETAVGWANRWLNGANVIEIAARPDNHELGPWGLDALLDILLSPKADPNHNWLLKPTLRVTVKRLASRSLPPMSPSGITTQEPVRDRLDADKHLASNTDGAEREVGRTS